MRILKIISLIIIIMALGTFPFIAQNIGINPSNSVPDPSAMVDISSPAKGLLIPRITLTSSTDAVTIPAPANSLLVYNTGTGGLSPAGYYYNSGTAGSPDWLMLQTAGSGTAWTLTGNSSTVDGTNFIGTTDNIPFNIRVNNQKSGRIDQALLNTFFGYQTGNANPTGAANAGYGHQALFSNTTGTGNIANGYSALYSNTSGGNNLAIGYQSLRDNSTGGNNVALGYEALNRNTTATQNIAIGTSSLYFNTTGTRNVSIGNMALYNNISGNDNIAMGIDALRVNTAGSKNIASGWNSLFNNTTGNSNLSLGYVAMYVNSVGNSNVAIGAGALFQNNRSNNVAVGDSALFSNSQGSAVATQGIENCATGSKALYSNTTGSDNTAGGFQSLYSNTTGSYNLAIGSQALYSSTTGNKNTAGGHWTLYYNTTGYENTAYGYEPLYANNTGYYNTAMGSQALFLNSSGYRNTAIGFQTLYSNDNGFNNTAIGYAAFNAGASYSNSMALGAFAVAISGSNQVHIGNGSVSSIQGQVGFTTYSDGRIKKDIKLDVHGLDFINELKPVTYYYDLDKENEITGSIDTAFWQGKYDIEKIRFSGFIAQEVEAAANKAGYDFSGIDKNGTMLGLRYSEFVVPLVKAVQELYEENQSLKADVQNLKYKLEVLEMIGNSGKKSQKDYGLLINNLK